MTKTLQHYKGSKQCTAHDNENIRVQHLHREVQLLCLLFNSAVLRCDMEAIKLRRLKR